MHSFEISDVVPETKPLPTSPGDEVLRQRLQTSFEASGTNLTDLVRNQLHPLVGAAHFAFAAHYPLVLSPDDIWLCIAQGFAAHVDANAEALRTRFVRHEGQAMITIRRDQFRKGSLDNDWPGCFSEFSDRIADHIGKKRDLVVADFSTTGPVERAASEVVLMAAMKHYFEYTLLTMCGIPRVTLLGTVDDWRSIRRRAAVLAEFDLGWWVDELTPLLDELVAAADGRPNVELWRSFYHWRDRSGGDTVTGWINVLFPYLPTRPTDLDSGAAASSLKPNPFVASWHGEQTRGDGPGSGDFPNGLSVAPFLWDYLGAKLPMELVAGFVGVSQDPRTLRIRPAIGWAVRDREA